VPDATSDDLARLLAHDEIRMLAARYAVAVDSRDLDGLVELFVPDVQVGAHVTGREALRGFFDRSLRDVGVTVLQVGGHVIDLDDAEHAHGTVYCRAGVQEGERWVEQAIAYLDAYERRDGRWLFVRRDHQLFYGVEAAERPFAQEPARWPASSTGVGTLPAAWRSWGAFWAEGEA
jgi:ketosteroid isomerase-like protein